MNSSSTQIFNPFHFPPRATQDNFSPQLGSGEEVKVRQLFTFSFSSKLCFCPISQTLYKCCWVPGTAVFIGHPGPQSPQLPFWCLPDKYKILGYLADIKCLAIWQIKELVLHQTHLSSLQAWSTTVFRLSHSNTPCTCARCKWTGRRTAYLAAFHCDVSKLSDNIYKDEETFL